MELQIRYIMQMEVHNVIDIKMLPFLLLPDNSALLVIDIYTRKDTDGDIQLK